MRIERSILISAAIGDVFAFVSDPHNDLLWCAKVCSVEQISGDGPGPGASYRVVHRPVPGRPAREMKYSLTEWDPPIRIKWLEDDGHDVIVVTYILQPSGERTMFTQRDDAELGAPRLLHPVIRAGIGHDVAGQLKRLRRQLEKA